MPTRPVGQPRPTELRRQFEAAALVYYRQLGEKPFNATDVIFPFMDAHPGEVSRPTLDRWVCQMIREGLIRRTRKYPERNNNRHHPNREAQLQRMARLNAIRDRHQATRAEREKEMAELMAPAALPLPVRMAMERGDAFAITANLKECIIAAHQCMDVARRMTDGIDAKLLITASEHLRRCMETCLRLHEQVYTLEKIDRFLGQVIEIVQRRSPDAAAEILERLQDLATTWRRIETETRSAGL